MAPVQMQQPPHLQLLKVFQSIGGTLSCDGIAGSRQPAQRRAGAQTIQR